ncbi:hypothetical protein P8452_03383 [Trifolium repens]|nr:hypothetical protein P8452_03383 [Trifolium repens]
MLAWRVLLLRLAVGECFVESLLFVGITGSRVFNAHCNISVCQHSSSVLVQNRRSFSRRAKSNPVFVLQINYRDI